jgi:hypothetical protein
MPPRPATIHGRARSALSLGLISAGLLALPQPGNGVQSPWWENYDLKESYRCTDQAVVVLERNASQAALIANGFSSTLFREPSETPALRYSNEQLRVVLRGDELTLEQLPQVRTCIRTQEV